LGQIILKGNTPEYPDVLSPWVIQFKQFIQHYRIKPVLDCNGNQIIEYPLYSLKMDVAGTPDLLAHYGNSGKIGLFDWKSATGFSKSWRAQTACYSEMCKEAFGIKNKIIHIPVRFDEEGYYPDFRENHPEDLNWFRSINNVLREAA
jgi:hypothetical protein